MGMKRAWLTLSPFNPRRRLRDRLLAAMLVVALVPAAAFFVLTAVSLHGITQQTVNGAYASLVQRQEGSFQTGLNTTANSVIQNHLSGLRAEVQALATTLGNEASAASPSPSPSASSSPSASANAATPAPTPGVTSGSAGTAGAPAATGSPDAAGGLQSTALGDGVYEVSSPASSSAAELLVGVPPNTPNTPPVLTRAAALESLGLDQFATGPLAKAAVKEGSLVDAVWVMDPADYAVWISPGGFSSLPEGEATLANNPQGITLTSLDLLPNFPAPQTPAGSPAVQWTDPYTNSLHGDLEVTVYALADHGLVVGADVPLAQFSSAISQAPAELNSYPLLLDNDTNQVIATGSTDKDFTLAPRVGAQLPRAGGQGRRGGARRPARGRERRDLAEPHRGDDRGRGPALLRQSCRRPGVDPRRFRPQDQLRAQRLGAQGGHQLGADRRLPGRSLDRRDPAAGVLPPRHPALPLRRRPGQGADGVGRAARRGPHRRGGTLAGQGRGR